MQMKVALAVGIAVCAAQAQVDERKFNVHGFMDMQVENQQFIGDGSMYSFIGLDEDFHARLEHVNLYFDFAPNEHVRSLAEIRFLTQRDGMAGLPGIITDIEFRAGATGSTVSDTTEPVVTGTYGIDAGSGGFFEWGGLSLERAWMQVMVHQALNFTLGLFLTPVGIWNEDHGSPVVTSVQTPYGFSFIPLFPNRQVGVMAHGCVFLGDVDLDYFLTASTGRTMMNITRFADVAVGGRVAAEWAPGKSWLQSLSGGFSGYSGMLRDRRAWQKISFAVDVFGDSASVAHDFGDGFSNPDNKQNWYETTIEARETALGLDFKYVALKSLTFQTEFLYQLLQNHLADDARTHTFDWYAMARYTMRPLKYLNVTPYAMFERMWANDGDNNPASWFAGNERMRGQVIDAFNVYTVGTNLNVFTNFTVKLEGNYIDARTSGVMKPYPDVWDMCTANVQFAVAF